MRTFMNDCWVCKDLSSDLAGIGANWISVTDSQRISEFVGRVLSNCFIIEVKE